MTTVVNETTKKLTSLLTDDDGNLKIAGSFSAEAPVGGATEAKQDDIITAIEGITIDPPVGGATEAKQDTIISGLSSIDGHVDGIEGLLGTSNTNTSATNTSVGTMSAKLPSALGKKTVATSLAANAKSGGDEYETVAASQTTQTIGATGAVGDYLEGVLVVVATAATSQVDIKDGSNTAINIFPNNPGAGIGSFYIPLGLTSVQGAWQITTGAGVSVIAMGDFT